MTTAERNAISNPADGLVIFNTTTGGLNYYFSGGWYKLAGILQGSISSLECSVAVITGTLIQGVAASGVSAEVDYTGGNGGTHHGQIVTSTGVTGLTATLAAGSFDTGAGSLIYTITGTPMGSGTASLALDIGGQTCTLELTVAASAITMLDCTNADNTGTLVSGVLASDVSSSVPYTGGNGGSHSGQTVNSTGVTGLTATAPAGNFAIGAGSLIYSIAGTPFGSGTASFALNIGGKTCSLEITVLSFVCGTSTMTFTYKGSSVTYGTVMSAGRCWLDRNLGATQVATSSTDAAAYGDLFQWGRLDDGHQGRTSPTTTTLSSSDVPGHGNFILAPSHPNDWRSPQNPNLWQGVNGTNNVCPDGYRLPTEAELDTERTSWGSNNAAGAFASPLKLPVAGYRSSNEGSSYEGSNGYYWSSSVGGIYAWFLGFSSGDADVDIIRRAGGFSVRCIKD